MPQRFPDLQPRWGLGTFVSVSEGLTKREGKR